ncbi:hypothetical protein [Yoonia sp. MH D7]
MTMKKDLAQLSRLTSVALLAAQSEMAVAKARETELRATLKSLYLSRNARAVATLGLADTSLVAGADSQWLIWVEQRRRLINSELARCLVVQDRCLQAVRRAFGRDQAVAALERARKAGAKKDAARRADYTS